MKNKKINFILFLLIILFLHIQYSNQHDCSKVSNLPPNYNSLIPDYQNLTQIHSFTYHFLDEEEIKTSIKIKNKSVFKVVSYAFNVEFKFRLIRQASETSSQEGLLLPIVFTEYNAEGEYILIFEKIRDAFPKRKDLLCKQPYILLEVIIENIDIMEKKIESIKENNQLESISTLSLQGEINQLMNEKEVSLSTDKDSKFKTYSINTEKQSYYQSLNLYVYKDFNFEVPRISILKESTELQSRDEVNYYNLLLNISLMSDFLFGGSMKIVLVKIDELNKDASIRDNLKDLNCVKNGICLISKRVEKNKETLQAAIGSGQYLLLLLDTSSSIESDMEFTKSKLDKFPITFKVDMKRVDNSRENRYDCSGVKFPSNFNVKNYFLIKENIIINMNTLLEVSEFYNSEDSLLRIITSYNKGNSIKISLYMENNEKKDFNQLIEGNNNDLKDSFTSNISNEFNFSSTQRDKLKSSTSSVGESDGLVFPLRKDKRYRLIFNYHDSMLSNNEDNSCQTMFVHLEVASLKHLKEVSSESFEDCKDSESNLSNLRSYLKAFGEKSSQKEVLHMVNKNEDTTFEETFSSPVDIMKSSGIALSGSFKLAEEAIIYVELEYNFILTNLIPFIIPKDYSSKVNVKVDDASSSSSSSDNSQDSNINENIRKINKVDSGEHAFHRKYQKIHLKPGEYYLVIYHGINQFSNGVTNKNKNSNDNSSYYEYFFDLPKCGYFKLRLSSFRIINKEASNWSCAYENFRLVPILMSNNIKTSFIDNFYSEETLIPYDFSTTRVFIPNSSSSSSSNHLLKVKFELPKSSILKKSFKVQLSKGGSSGVNLGKIVAYSDFESLNYSFKTVQKTISYVIEKDVYYFIEYFLDDGENKKEEGTVSESMKSVYFSESSCPLFKLSIEILDLDEETEEKEDLCKSIQSTGNIIPKQDSIIYIKDDNTNMFLSYESSYDIFFNMFFKNDNNPEKKKEKKEIDPEKDINKDLFIVRLKKEEAFTFNLDFSISSKSKLTIVLQGISHISNISILLFKFTDNTKKYMKEIANDEMVSSTNKEMNNITVESGEYRLYIKESSYSQSLNESLLNSLKQNRDCEVFKLILFIEPNNYFISNYNSLKICQNDLFPSSLNRPGLLDGSSNYILNISGRYSIEKESKIVIFSIFYRSIFKIGVSDGDSSLVKDIRLYKVNNDGQTNIFSIIEEEDDVVNLVLPKGNYKLVIDFKNVDKESTSIYEDCLYFNINLTIVPSRIFKDGKIPFEINHFKDEFKCDETGSNDEKEFPTVTPSSLIQYREIVLKNQSSEDGKYNNNHYLIKIDSKDINKGNVLGEFHYNPYLDTQPAIRIFKYSAISKEKSVNHIKKAENEDDLEDDEVRVHFGYKQEDYEFQVQFEVFYHENSIWISFITQKDYNYNIRIFPVPFLNYSKTKIPNYSSGRLVCSHLLASIAFQVLDAGSNSNSSIKSVTKQKSCEITNLLPKDVFKKSDFLVDFGGNQNHSDSSIDFYGKFLIPEENTEHTISFVVKDDVYLFINIVSLYEDNNNISIYLYDNEKTFFNYKKSDIQGQLMVNISEKGSYRLVLKFDKTRKNCETIEFSFIIQSKKVFNEETLACNSLRQKLPSEDLNDFIRENKSISMTDYKQTFYTQFSLDKSFSNYDSSYIIDESDGDYLKRLSFKLEKPSAVSFVVDHSYIQSSIELGLSAKSDLTKIIKVSETRKYHHDDELYLSEELFIQLVPGEYSLVIVFKGYYLNSIRKLIKTGNSLKDEGFFKSIFSENVDEKIEKFCFNYDFDIQIKELSLPDDYLSRIIGPYVINDDEISQLIPNSSNLIVSISPSESIDLKPSSDLQLIFKFQKVINSKLSSYLKTGRMVYLAEESKEFNKSYAKNVFLTDDKDPTEVVIVFETDDFSVNKCYNLVMEETDLFTKETYTHKYCTVKCDCNQNAKYKCTNNNNCKCEIPYFGEKCERCIDGFRMNNKGRCIRKGLSICDEKLNCSGKGRCDKNKCVCNKGFGSDEDATFTFCNKCLYSGYFPNCELDNSEEEGFDFNSPCSAYGPSLPKKILLSKNVSSNESQSNDENENKDENQLLEDEGLFYKQDFDGSFEINHVFKINDSKEVMQFHVVEESLMKVFFLSNDLNRAKVSINSSLDEDSNSLATTQGNNPTESFIVKLTPKDSPYYLVIDHISLSYSCSRYLLKLSLKPMNEVVDSLKCPDLVNLSLPLDSLPKTSYIISKSSQIELSSDFNIVDFLIVNDLPNKKLKFTSYKFPIDKKSKEDKEGKDYDSEGFYSKGNMDEEFEYNIKIEVTEAPITFFASIRFEFIMNDIRLTLRQSNGEIISTSEYLLADSVVNESNDEVEDAFFTNYISRILDPGDYFLTLSQNLGSNHIIQMIYDKNSAYKVNSNRCFGFRLNLQSSLIDKPKEISTQKYETLFNRIISVEPPGLSYMKPLQRIQIFITFEDSIKTVLKDENKTFKEVFFLVDDSGKVFLPIIAKLQGFDNKVILLEFKSTVLVENSCYQLDFNLGLLLSVNDKTILKDNLHKHKYCSKKCNCNPHASFKCSEEASGKCECNYPYTGEYCESCMDDFILLSYKCVKKDLCNKIHCNSHGLCKSISSLDTYFSNYSVQDRIKQNPICQCDDDFKGNKSCSECSSKEKRYPNCEKNNGKLEEAAKKEQGNQSSSLNLKEKEKESQVNEGELSEIVLEIETLDNKEDETLERKLEINNIMTFVKCEFPFIPTDLDSLAYLHLDGELHISGLYSLRHISNQHLNMHFSLKEKTRFKIYIEHSNQDFIVLMFLLDQNHKLIQRSEIHFGPGGISTSGFIDVILDPLMGNYSNDSFYNTNIQQYEVSFYIKKINSKETLNLNYDDVRKNSELYNECFNSYVEIQFERLDSKSKSSEDKQNKENNKEKQCETLVSNIFESSKTFDYHTFNYQSMKGDYFHQKFRRDTSKYNIKDTIYFHYEYFYIPNTLDKEVLVELTLLSKFLNSHVGVLLELVEIPSYFNGEPLSYKNLSSEKLKEIIGEVDGPLCKKHCFTGVKRHNSVELLRLLPGNEYVRLWFFDLSPSPQNTFQIENDCVDFEYSFRIEYVSADVTSTYHNKRGVICENKELPKNLNEKDYLGDSSYLKKWGFHLLDEFSIDQSLLVGLSHRMDFEIIDSYYILRLLIVHGSRIETDLELYRITDSNEEIIAKSITKNFEEVLSAELPIGKYFILFKFFPDGTGFNKCEKLKIEFSMDLIDNMQLNIDRMIDRQGKAPLLNEVNIFQHLNENNGKDELDSDLRTYLIKMEEPIEFSSKTNTRNQGQSVESNENSVIVSQLSFTISKSDSNKIELYATVISDFLLLDASIYLTETNSMKTIVASHEKNLNVLSSGRLESGSYVLSVKYYKRIHFNSFKSQVIDEFGRKTLENFSYMEMEFDAQLVNLSEKDINVNTSKGSITLKPIANQSYSWKCRQYGIQIPKTLNSLRHMQFYMDSHIIDRYLIPNTSFKRVDEKVISEGEDNELYENSENYIEEVIQFKSLYSDQLLLRIYVEAHDVDIDISLFKVLINNKKQLVVSSQESSHFETISQMVHKDILYEISLKFKYPAKYDSQSCKTFKMEIATESGHNYSCPDIVEYKKLTDLDFFPDSIPYVKDRKIARFKYNSKDFFKGEDKKSGFLYMLRTEQDQEYILKQFNVTTDVDMKIEVTFDFAQAPLNTFITKSGNKSPDYKQTMKDYLIIHSNDKIDNDDSNYSLFFDSDILSYGKIFENRSVLLVRNLPIGEYSLWVFLPGLKTRYFHEPRVCSVYDILAEVIPTRKAESSFISKINKAIERTGLNIPSKLPLTLDNIQFFKKNHEENEKYVNVLTEFIIEKQLTEANDNEKENGETVFTSETTIEKEISFKLHEKSIFYMALTHQYSTAESIKVRLDDKIESDIINEVISEGEHTLKIIIRNANTNIQVYNKTIHRNIYIHIGLAQLNRYKEIKDYNKIQSNNPLCITKVNNYAIKLLELDEEESKRLFEESQSKVNLIFIESKDLIYYFYHNDFITFNRRDLSSTGQLLDFNIVLPNESRLYAYIGSDFILNLLELRLVSGNKEFEGIYNNNLLEIDLLVPPGQYNIRIRLINGSLLLAEQDCILLSLYIKIIDIKLSSIRENELRKVNPSFENLHDKEFKSMSSLLLQTRCEVNEVLPFEVSSENGQLKSGEFQLHIDKSNYYNHITYAKSGNSSTNPNKIDIKLDSKSLIRVWTSLDEVNNIAIVPKLNSFPDWNVKSINETYDKHSFYGNKESNNENSEKLNKKKRVISYDSGFTSFSGKERNYLWITDNKYSTLQLNRIDLSNKENDYSEMCIYYGIDVFILPISTIVETLKCGSTVDLQSSIDNHELKLPKRQVNVSKPNEDSIWDYFSDETSYFEEIPSGYFTINQLSSIYIDNDSFKGIRYIVDFEVRDKEKEYNVDLELGFYNSISYFDIYLVKKEPKKKGSGEKEMEEMIQGSKKVDSYEKEVFDNKLVANSELRYVTEIDNVSEKDKTQRTSFPYRRLLNTNVSKGLYSIVIHERVFSDINSKIISESKYSDVNLCLPFSYKLKISHINDKFSFPSILSIDPKPNKVTIFNYNVGIPVKIRLSKLPYTNKHQTISNFSNKKSLLNAFYFIKKDKKTSSSSSSIPKQGDTVLKVYPLRVEGSSDSKEWEFLFEALRFDIGYDYQLTYDSSWLFDSYYSQFVLDEAISILPIIRIAQKRPEIVSFIDTIKDINEKSTVNNAEKEEVQVTISQKEQKAVEMKAKLGNIKCEHGGKAVYNNIVQKEFCSCVNGWQGKYCNDCVDGVIDGESCVYIDKSNEEVEVMEVGIVEKEKEKEKEEKNSPCKLKCVNGYCDIEQGKCICDLEYKGEACEEKVTKSSKDEKNEKIAIKSKTNTENSSKNTNFFDFSMKILKIFFYIGLVIVALYIILLLSKSLKRKYEIPSSVSKDNGKYTELPDVDLINDDPEIGKYIDDIGIGMSVNDNE